MIRRIVAFMAASTVCFATNSRAQDAGVRAGDAGTAQAVVEPPPPIEMIKKVLDYQENGKDRGPALLDLIPCTKVDSTNGSPTKFQCVEPVTKAVPKGTTVYAWLQWLCPKDGKYEDVKIKFLHEGEVRKTVDLPVIGTGRTRGWRGEIFSKVGKWTIKVLRGDTEIASTTVDVVSI